MRISSKYIIKYNYITYIGGFRWGFMSFLAVGVASIQRRHVKNIPQCHILEFPDTQSMIANDVLDCRNVDNMPYRSHGRSLPPFGRSKGSDTNCQQRDKTWLSYSRRIDRGETGLCLNHEHFAARRRAQFFTKADIWCYNTGLYCTTKLHQFVAVNL